MISLKAFLRKLQNLSKKPITYYLIGFFAIFASFFAIELVLLAMLGASTLYGLAFGFLWSALFACLILFLPRLAGRITFGIAYFGLLLWALAQSGYYTVLGNMMWVSTTTLAKESATFIGDVLSQFPAIWWIAAAVMIVLGVAIICIFPYPPAKFHKRIPYLVSGAVCIIGLCFPPELIFCQDKVTATNYNAASSRRATYTTLYDAKEVYDITGLYQLLARDIWVNEIYPHTPLYQSGLAKQENQIDAFFDKRTEKTTNEMTGAFAGKNVILVMMESMDDWMITPQDTPTLYRLM